MTRNYAPKKKIVLPLTEEELNAVTIVFHQYETGLREGTIYTRVRGDMSHYLEVGQNVRVFMKSYT